MMQQRRGPLLAMAMALAVAALCLGPGAAVADPAALVAETAAARGSGFRSTAGYLRTQSSRAKCLTFRWQKPTLPEYRYVPSRPTLSTCQPGNGTGTDALYQRGWVRTGADQLGLAFDGTFTCLHAHLGEAFYVPGVALCMYHANGSSIPEQSWLHDSSGRLRLLKAPSKCLTQPLLSLNPVDATLPTLEPCESPLSPRQVWGSWDA